ncbi:MAG TPA: alanyl-tRNA editing protein [Solirubrobacteraceae bacterium]
MTTDLLYLTDAYLREFDAEVVAVDTRRGAVALARTAFFPGGGGQPHDTGELQGAGAVLRVVRDGDGVVWHELEPGSALPAAGAAAHGVLDWERRHLLMRTHTALHLLNGVIWLDHGAQVTGADMTPGAGRADFSLPAISQEFGREVEARVNAQVALDLPIRVDVLPRAQADHDPSLIRSKANLIPRSIDPLRVVDIVGLDRQADSGTHVASTAEVGTVRVTGTQSKGRDNKRVRIALEA